LLRRRKTLPSVRVLIADDNPEIISVIRETLRATFDVVGSFADGESVLLKAPLLHPDVIVLDISIPDMNGFEILRRLKQMECPASVVFLTVHEGEDFVRAALELGALGYVFKSKLVTDLPRAIEEVSAGNAFIPQGMNYQDLLRPS
jgi:DNA-binding NarL/FixJ family response regulator